MKSLRLYIIVSMFPIGRFTSFKSTLDYMCLPNSLLVLLLFSLSMCQMIVLTEQLSRCQAQSDVTLTPLRREAELCREDNRKLVSAMEGLLTCNEQLKTRTRELEEAQVKQHRDLEIISDLR